MSVGCTAWTVYNYFPFSTDCPTLDDVFNVQSLETAIWTAAPGNLIFDAEAVCGGGTIDDVDIPSFARTQATGNGPSNLNFCGA